MSDSYLDIVDESDVIIGEASRSDIHKQGFRHREVHVWFITKLGEVIFQKRADDKDTFPGLLDATVGGHVEQGATYEQAALAEVEEETGLKLSIEDLCLIEKRQSDKIDKITGMRNNVFRMIYGYIFPGVIADLKIESGFGAGFRAYKLDALFNPTPEMHKEFIPGLLDPNKHYLYQSLQRLIT